MSAADETQAAEYRRMMRARTRNKIAAELGMSGVSSLAADVRADWQPVLDWLNWLEEIDDGRDETDDNEYGQIFNLNPGVE
jgi:hypothetical protein